MVRVWVRVRVRVRWLGLGSQVRGRMTIGVNIRVNVSTIKHISKCSYYCRSINIIYFPHFSYNMYEYIVKYGGLSFTLYFEFDVTISFCNDCE